MPNTIKKWKLSSSILTYSAVLLTFLPWVYLLALSHSAAKSP